MPATWKSLGLALTSASVVIGGQAIASVPSQVFESQLIVRKKKLAMSLAGETWCTNHLVGISNTFHTLELLERIQSRSRDRCGLWLSTGARCV